MRRRTAVKVASGAAAIVMATASAGWGDAPDQGVPVPVPVPPYGTVVVGGYADFAKLTITNATGADAGGTYTDCSLANLLAGACGRPLTVTGTNITNTIDEKVVGEVELWWLDEPFAAVALRQPDLVENRLGQLCKEKGVRLPQVSAPVPVTGGSFTATVTAPPNVPTTADGTVRPVHAYYGLNAVCATWDHTNDGLSHVSATAVTHTIRPAL